VATVPRLEDLPGVPDAVYIGINRAATVEAVAVLAAMGAGGAVCFASGFAEAAAELADGPALQAALLAAAGDMPILGPNCYGLLNALERVALWPDLHGLVPVERGVAVVTQSSNIALNLTMQARGLPLAYVGTVGNQAQVDLPALAGAMLADPRVTALGLHIEGIRDLRSMEGLAAAARDLGKPIVALKVGASAQAQAATVSHTASLAGSDAGARALLRRLGMAQMASLPELLEALKLLHVTGPLASDRIGALSCSGGEASLMADSALGRSVSFPPLTAAQQADLRAALGPKVALANPLDYHTYIWGDVDAMTACFAGMLDPNVALGTMVFDRPRADRCDGTVWDLVLEAMAAASRARGVPMALIASLPETMTEDLAARALAMGLVPFAGIDEALAAIEAAAWLGARPGVAAPILLPGPERSGDAEEVLSEPAAKAALAAHGLSVPRGHTAEGPGAAATVAAEFRGRVVLKGLGEAHKTDAGAVRVGLAPTDVAAAAAAMGTATFLVEEYVTGAIVELLIGVVRDPAHGFVLTLGAGGTLTEILQDTASLLLPVTEEDVRGALDRLRLAPQFYGYRGAEAVDLDAVVAAVMAVQSFVTAERARVMEVEINPLICGPEGAIAVDALVRWRETA
jgi:acyl-CoA synthetase (NDP forming)